MKQLLTILFVLQSFIACTKETSIQNPTQQAQQQRVAIRNNTVYWGYPLHSIQRNQDSSYRATYFRRGDALGPSAILKVDGRIPAQNFRIERPFAQAIIWLERVNGQFTGRYVAEVPQNYGIGLFIN